MNLNLEQAFDEPVDLSHDLELSRESLARPELTGLQPISFRGRLQRTDPGFVLTGKMSFSGLVECARCLTDVPFTRTADVSWTFAPSHRQRELEGEELEERELLDGDIDITWYDDLQVPFDPLIEEQVQLEIPMKPLCRPDCKGLCPSCGADRNVTACSCVKPSDERWDALKTLTR